MGIFNKIKEITKKVTEVETNIYNEKRDYLEIYERNQELEREISQRTEELEDANKRMFTLQHIWNMMNSSTPLENVLDAIVNSTQGELGYVHCSILRKCKDENGDFIRILAQAKDSFVECVNEVIASPSIQTRRLNYDYKSIFNDTLISKTISQSKVLDCALMSLIPDISKEQINKILADTKIKSLITIPLSIQDTDFGWFCVFSSREELAESEMDFLALFAKQVELAITIANLFQAVREQAVTDALTGLYNRRYFEESLDREYQRAKRQKQPFSIIGIDLDYLKKINDTYGHSFGDLAITTIAKVLQDNARSIDVPARIGGEEFNVLLPGVNSEGAMAAAQRIRKAIEDSKIDTVGTITGSLGVATFFEHTENLEELLELTDQAMYTSKREGRNRVTLAKPINEVSWQEIAINTFIDILSKNRLPVAQNLSRDLCEQLTQNKQKINNDSLYAVSDALIKLYNPMHSEGVIKNKVLTAVSLAKRFDLPKEQVDNLRVAILLYDIGNLMLPQELLQKATPLTEDEIIKIKNHPIIAAQEILKPISYIQDILPIIENHHENWDGSGYPNNISKDDIPITSQIILIIDEYFALIEQRPYRQKQSSKDALEIIKSDSGKKWNDNLVQEFISLIEHDIV